MVIPANLRVDRSPQSAEALRTRREAQPVSAAEAIIVERDREKRKDRKDPKDAPKEDPEFTPLEGDGELPPLEVYNHSAHETVLAAQHSKLDVKA